MNKTDLPTTAVKFTIERDGKNVGHAFLFLIFNELHDKKYGLMEDVYVEEEYRGQGIGKELVNGVIEEAKVRGCYKLLAQSRYGREHVHELYKKFGFNDHGKNFRMDFN